MGIVYVSFAISLILAFIVCKKFKDWVEIVMSFLITTVMFTAAATLIAILIGFCLPTVQVANEPVYLHGLYDDMEISGRFYLGSGYVDQDKVYHYRYFDQEGASIGRSVPYELEEPHVRTFEDEQERPYLITYHNEFQEEWMKLIAIQAKADEVVQYDFHIPVNSIDDSYSTR